MSIRAAESFVGLEGEKPSTGAQPGDLWYSEDTGNRYIWDAIGIWKPLGNKELLEALELDRMRKDYDSMMVGNGDHYGFEIR